MAKTGRKIKGFVEYGGQTVQDCLNGSVIGLSLAEQNKTYYTMIPTQGRKWLGRDKDKAVLKFRALVANLKGEKETNIVVNQGDYTNKIQHTIDHTKPNLVATRIDGKTKIEKGGRYTVVKKYAEIPEFVFIEWLKKELQNPTELARKTGIEAFNHFWDYVNQEPIKLTALIDNFFELRKRSITQKEEQKTRKAWSIFCKLIDKKTAEEITLNDILKYETFIHKKNYAPATIKHYLSRIEKIFNYNAKKYQDNHKLIKISNWCKGMERLEVNNSKAPDVIDLNTFNLLYDNADLEMKAMLLLGLNSASYLIDLSRYTKDEIDLGEQTLITQRQKKGQVTKVCYLWDRTVNILKEYLATRNDNSTSIFKSRYGVGYTDSGLRKKFKRLKQSINDRLKQEDKPQITIEYNNLRDTFSTLSRDLGIDPFKINCVMGHSNKGMIDRYTKKQITNNLKEACITVEKAFFSGK